MKEGDGVYIPIFGATFDKEVLGKIEEFPNLTEVMLSESIKDTDEMYDNALKSIDKNKYIQKFYVGREIYTKYGRGIIVKIEIDFDNVHVVPEIAHLTVWYGKKGEFAHHKFILSEAEYISESK